MSLDLVSKSLDLEDTHDDTSISVKTKRKKRPNNNTSNNAMDFIRSDRQGVWKELRKVQKKQQKEITEKRKKQSFKSALEIYHEKNNIDNTERNIEALLKATELGKVQSETAGKILYQQPNRLSRDIVDKPSIKEEGTVFTEEDFEKFAREYNP